MSYNGSGTFLVNSAGQPVVTGTVISSTAFNALTADLATGLSTAITKDGQTTPTANIKLGGFKLTNVGTATTAGDALIFGSGTNSSTLAVPTRQVLTSGTTYTTPANVRQLKIRMVGGGGGGCVTGGGAAGSPGTASSFNSITAAFGPGASVPGTGNFMSGNGTGSASYRQQGMAGASGIAATSGAGGVGGSSVFGGGAAGGWYNSGTVNGMAAAANSGSGGGGGGVNATITNTGGGGSAAEYVELIINSPAASYTYAIGAGGAGSTTGSDSYHGAGGNGGSGVIIVDEIY